MRATHRALALIAVAHALPAAAQWSPHISASIGRSYGALALSQSVLNNTRQPGSNTPQQPVTSTPPAAADANTAATDTASAPARMPTRGTGLAALTYTPDPHVSEQTRLAMIATLTDHNPGARPELERAFARNAVLAEFSRRLASRGYSMTNIADDLAELLLTSWEIVTGSTASAAQIRGVHEQARHLYLQNAELKEMTNTERQQLAERIAYQVVLGASAMQEILRAGDRIQLAQLQQSAAGMMQQQGIDIARLRVTEHGFSR